MGQNEKINLSSIKNLASFQVNNECCLKTSNSSSLNAHPVQLPIHSTSFNNILPAYKKNVLRADHDVTFSHCPSLQTISSTTSKLQLLKKQYDGLSYLKTILKITMHLKSIENTVASLNLSLCDMSPRGLTGVNRTVDTCADDFLTLSSALKSGLSECCVAVNEALTLVKNLGASCRNKLHHEKVIKNINKFDYRFFKLSYCKDLAKQVRTLARRVSTLQTDIDTRDDNAVEYRFISSLYFHCDTMLTSLRELSFSIKKIFYKGKSESSSIDYGFLLVDVWSLSNGTEITEDYNVTTYLNEVAQLRSVPLAKRMCTLLPNILIKNMKLLEKTTGETIENNSQVFTSNKSGLHLKSKDVAKILRQSYLNLVSQEQKYFNQLLKEILEISNDKSLTSNHYLERNSRNPNKVIVWNCDIGPALEDFIYEFYAKALWNCVNLCIRNCYISFLDDSEVWCGLDNLYLCRTKSNIVWTCVDKLLEDNVAGGMMESLSTLLLSITTFHNLQQWDHGFCQAMGAMLKDKFRYTNESPGIPSSLMVNSLLRTQMKQIDIITYFKLIYQKQIGHYNNDHVYFSFDNCVFLPQRIFLSYITFCLCLKRQQFLISGCWNQFFVVTSVDMKIILYFIDHLLNDMQDHFVAKSELLTTVITYLTNEYELFKTFERKSLKIFLKAIIYRSQDGFEKYMPKGKVWRRKGYRVVSQEVNPYVSVITNLIFPALLDNLNCVSKQKRNEIVEICIKLFIKTWMEVILDNQIMFSWFGANQLKLDFEQFLKWFEEDHSSYSADELRELQPLAALKDMRNAIRLLLCQPQGRRNTLIPINNIGHSILSTSSSSTVSEASIDMFSGNQFDQVIFDVDLHDKERWLALRVKTNQPSKFLCLR